MPSVFAALDQTFRRLGGVPAYVLTDNEKTVTTEHIAGIAVRDGQLVGFAGHYSVVVHTCVPADPASRGGTESSVTISTRAHRTTNRPPIEMLAAERFRLHPVSRMG